MRLAETVVGAAPVAAAGADAAFDPGEAGADGGKARDAAQALAEVLEEGEGFGVVGRLVAALQEDGDEGESVEEVALGGGEVEIAQHAGGVFEGAGGAAMEVVVVLAQ